MREFDFMMFVFDINEHLFEQTSTTHLINFQVYPTNFVVHSCYALSHL